MIYFKPPNLIITTNIGHTTGQQRAEITGIRFVESKSDNNRYEFHKHNGTTPHALLICGLQIDVAISNRDLESLPIIYTMFSAGHKIYQSKYCGGHMKFSELHTAGRFIKLQWDYNGYLEWFIYTKGNTLYKMYCRAYSRQSIEVNVTFDHLINDRTANKLLQRIEQIDPEYKITAWEFHQLSNYFNRSYAPIKYDIKITCDSYLSTKKITTWEQTDDLYNFAVTVSSDLGKIQSITIIMDDIIKETTFNNVKSRAEQQPSQRDQTIWQPNQRDQPNRRDQTTWQLAVRLEYADRIFRYDCPKEQKISGSILPFNQFMTTNDPMKYFIECCYASNYYVNIGGSPNISDSYKSYSANFRSYILRSKNRMLLRAKNLIPKKLLIAEETNANGRVICRTIHDMLNSVKDDLDEPVKSLQITYDDTGREIKRAYI